MHFPALIADQHLTPLQDSTIVEATRVSPIQILCVTFIALGLVTKAVFAVESLDWLDYAVLGFLIFGIWYCRRPAKVTYIIL
ncbi:hypothetical protein NHQ30_007762 [Ciborinia camelliae]|nr:hypothetical protein NHQ30_007762 [Ciborinia camelliae]